MFSFLNVLSIIHYRRKNKQQTITASEVWISASECEHFGWLVYGVDVETVS